MPTTTPFNNLITFSRGSNATVTGSNGLIQWAPNNLLTFSEQFDNAAWSKQDLTATPNALSAPDGTTTADRILETATNVLHQVYVAYNFFTVGLTYTWSIYAKAQGRDWFWLEAHDGSNRKTWFNLVTGTVGTNAAGNTATITPVGDGWYRISLSRVAAGTNGYFAFGPANADGSSIYPGDITRGVNVWGAQLELGSTATTYNSTTVKNLLGFSEAFDNVGWIKLDASTVAGAQANPINGLFNAQKLMEGAANAQHAIFRSATVTAAPYTFSLYAKLAPGATRFLSVYPQGSGAAWAIFDLNLGTITAVSALNYVSSSITPVGGGWYRCSVTLNASAGTLNCAAYLSNSSGNSAPTYTGDGNSGVYIYGAQLSDSASLDPYVPTPGAAPSSTAFYGPRFDFDPVTLQPRGLLVEEQRTNLLLNSVFGGAVSGTPGTAPTSWGSFANGSIVVTSLGRNFAANSIRVTTTSARHFYSQTVALAATGTWIITFKVNVGTAVRIDELLAFNTRPAGSTIQYFYNDAAQAASFVPPTGNGVLQVAVTTTGTSGNAEIRFGCGASNAVTADVTFWDAQWELGAFATSYIPTVASTVTRSADVATIGGSLFAQWYGQTEGTFVGEASFFGLNQANANGLLSASNGTSTESTSIYRTDVANNINSIIIDNSVTQLNYLLPIGFQPLKIALGYATNNTNAALNGIAQTTDTACTMPTNDRLLIGSVYSAGSFPANGHIRSINYIPARAADFQLQALTELPLVPTLDLDFLNNLYEA